MENVIFVSDPFDLKYFYNSKFDRLYFGNEFCEYLLPNEFQLKKVLEFTKKRSIKFTVVTPLCTDGTILKLDKLLNIVPKKTEVVFNDWGVLDIIKKKELVPIHGRLLCAITKDPRIDYCDNYLEYWNYFKTTNIQREYQRFLIKNNIFRIELDNVKTRV